MKKFKWTGDLEDDCFLEIDGYTAHVELLYDDLKCRAGKEKWKQEGWFVGVYKDYTPPAKDSDILFHSGEHAGMITSGEMARAIAEAILKPYL